MRPDPPGWSVASRVQEYGGGAWAIVGGAVWFGDADGQWLCQVTGDDAVPVDPEPRQPGVVRYTDMCRMGLLRFPGPARTAAAGVDVLERPADAVGRRLPVRRGRRS